MNISDELPEQGKSVEYEYKYQLKISSGDALTEIIILFVK